jgi:uncharacterized membrane protein YadS
MFALKMRLIMFIVAWVATRFMRRLSFPALIIAIVLEVLLSALHSAMSEKKESDSEKMQYSGQRVQLD